jgi:DNA-binding transcriptional LysR family regulator
MSTETEDSARSLAESDPKLARVTLGQFMVLSRLQRIAEGSSKGGTKSVIGANEYQKLRRLKDGLGGKALTETEDGLKLTTLGRQVVSDFRAFLSALRDEGQRSRRIHVGAADTWLHSVILPGLRSGRVRPSSFKWRVTNLDAPSIVESVRNGSVHFGVLREGERSKVRNDHEWVVFPKEPKAGKRVGYALIAGSDCGLKGDPDPAAWLRALTAKANGCSLYQHGGRWTEIRNAYNRTVGRKSIPDDLEPTVDCGTHLQAALAVRGAKAWCIVPADVAAIARSSDDFFCPLRVADESVGLILIYRQSVLDRLGQDGKAALAQMKDILRRSRARA